MQRPIDGPKAICRRNLPDGPTDGYSPKDRWTVVARWMGGATDGYLPPRRPIEGFCSEEQGATDGRQKRATDGGEFPRKGTDGQDSGGFPQRAQKVTTKNVIPQRPS